MPELFSVSEIANSDAMKLWKSTFARHHYLSDALTCHNAWVLCDADDTLIGFTSSMSIPGYKGRFIEQPRREHRTVIIPDYQGMGLGVRLSEWQGKHWHSQARRFFSKTSHPRMGEYRNASPLWQPTAHNGKGNNSYASSMEGARLVNVKTQVAYSHEYVGDDLDIFSVIAVLTDAETLKLKHKIAKRSS